MLRHYLTEVVIAQHRRVLTRLVFGCIDFRSHRGPCNRCLQIGRDHVETAEHVLLQCVGDEEVVTRRNKMRRRLLHGYHLYVPVGLSDDMSLVWLKRLIFSWDTVKEIAAFVFFVCMRLKNETGR